MGMIHRVGIPQAWWIANREVKRGEGFLGQVVETGKWVKDLVVGEKETIQGDIEKKYCIKICIPEGILKEIPIHFVFVDGRWQIAEVGGKGTFDSIEGLMQVRASKYGVDINYSYIKVYDRFQRHLAVEKEIESSGISTGKTVLKMVAGFFTSVFSYKFYQGEIFNPEQLVQAIVKNAIFLKRTVGCVFKLKDQDRYQMMLCNKDGQYKVFDLEIDSKPSPGQFGLRGGKKFESFLAFKEEVLKDAWALSDAENEVKKATAKMEIEREPTLPGVLPQPLIHPEIPSEPVIEKQVPLPKSSAQPLGQKPIVSTVAILPEVVPVEVQVARGTPPPERPDWLDLKESWVTVGKGKRLDKDIRMLMKNVETVRSLIACEAAGSLNTDERAFHAWVKALGGASEKLGAQDLETLERITRELPLLERFWLYEVAVHHKIVSGHRQERAMHALEHCLNADIKLDEKQQLVTYIAMHASQYGDARTKEDAIAFLKGKAHE